MILVNKRGRPRFVATLPFMADSELKFRDKFYGICATFKYREVMALSRALGICPRTIETWKYKERMPNFYTAMQVIEWNDRGRPMEQVPPCLHTADML